MSKCVVVSIFHSPEEEKAFAKIAEEIMFNPDKHKYNPPEEKPGKCVVVPIFHSPEEEELFSRYAKRRMNER